MKQGNQALKKKKIIEEKRRRAVRKIINEEMLLMAHRKRICELIISEDARLTREGYSPVEINGLLTEFMEKIPDAGIGYFKQYLAKMLLEHMGVTTDSIFGYILVNIIEELKWGNITQYFGGGSCKPLVGTIIIGIQEGMAEYGMDKLVESFTGNRRMDGIVAGPLREIIGEYLKEVTVKLRQPIEDFICNQSLGGMAAGLAGVFGGGALAMNTGTGVGFMDSIKSAVGMGGNNKVASGNNLTSNPKTSLSDTHNYNKQTGAWEPK